MQIIKKKLPWIDFFRINRYIKNGYGYQFYAVFLTGEI